MTMQRGFTVVEMIVSMSIIAILTGIMMFYTTTRLVQNAVDRAEADMQFELRQALDVMSEKIKEAAAVDTVNRNLDTIDGLTWTSASDTLVLAVPSENSSHDLIYEISALHVSWKDNFVYFLKGTDLFSRTLPSSAPGNSRSAAESKLAEHISNLTFTYYDDDGTVLTPPFFSTARSVEIAIDGERDVFNKTITASKKLQVTLRSQY